MPWSLKKIIKLGQQSDGLFKISIGNGKNTLFWHHPWLEGMPIIFKHELQGIRIRRDFNNAKVGEVKEGTWDSILRRNSEGTRILNVINQITFADQEDKHEWLVETKGKFCSNAVWQVFRQRGQEVGWANLVWSTKIIPRHQFILWLTFWERLSTRDRISKFMSIDDSKCLLCSMEDESIAHIFGNCSYAAPIWRRLAAALKINTWPTNWEGICSLALTKAKGNSFTINVFKCYFGSIIYQIWMERNARIYSRVRRNEIQTWREICFDSNSLINTWRRIPDCVENRDLGCRLGINVDEVMKLMPFKVR